MAAAFRLSPYLSSVPLLVAAKWKKSLAGKVARIIGAVKKKISDQI